MKKNPWIAAILNFFLLGPGYIYNGKRKMLGIGFTLSAIFATWVEFQIKEMAPELYPYAFGQFFLMAALFAYDGFREAKELNQNK